MTGVPPKPLAALNWMELERLVARLRPEAEGLFAEQVLVPDRPRFPGGYIKGEWSIRLSGRKTWCTCSPCPAWKSRPACRLRRHSRGW